MIQQMPWQLPSQMHLPKNMINIAIRIIALLLFGIRWWYWKVTERVADKEKPKQEKYSWYYLLSKTCWYGIYVLLLLQIVGLSIFPITRNIITFQIIGLTMVIVGIGISLRARYQLGTNWTNGYEYQIKKDQNLITTGMYSYIRHPIYLGLTVSFIGGELVAESWLFVSYCFLLVGFYTQARREEKILLAHFGNAYKSYMKKTKMLIPFLL